MLQIGLTLFVTKVNGFSTEMVHLWTKCRWSQYASCVWWAWQYVVLEKIISTGTKLSDNSMLFNALMPVEIEDSLTRSCTYFFVLLTTLILSRVCLMLIIMIIIWQFCCRKREAAKCQHKLLKCHLKLRFIFKNLFECNYKQLVLVWSTDTFSKALNENLFNLMPATKNF